MLGPVGRSWRRFAPGAALAFALAGIVAPEASDAAGLRSQRRHSGAASARLARPQKSKTPRTAGRRAAPKPVVMALAASRVATEPAETAGPPSAIRQDAVPASSAAIATALIGLGLPEPLITAAPLRETGAHVPPVAPPAQLEAPPNSGLLRASPVLRMRSAYTRRSHPPLDATEADPSIAPVRLAMLPRLSLPAPLSPMPPVALPGLAPGPWSEPHMERDELPLGRWAKPALPLGFDKVHFAPHAPQRCLPAKLKKAIYDIAERVGEVRVISTHRDHARNRRVGGATRSMHLECRAVDFVVPGRHRNLIAFLRSRSDIGGYKRYPGGSYHIDDGPRRTW